MLVLIAVAFIIFLVLYIQHTIQQKYIDFVNQNSIALKKLLEINQQYVFYPYIDLNQTHTYDNENFYDNISCSDYLIYQLQYLSPQIFDQVKKVDSNKQKYQSYLSEVEAIQFGQFQCPIGNLDLDKVLDIEKNLVNKTVQIPVTQFDITVTLYCSKINGRIYDRKIQSFCVEEIFSFINRLKNKSGTFYNDRDIWNSLCRVELGKVSNKMRFSIYERDGYRCCRCGVSERYAPLEIDHIIPISKGGKSTYENLQTLCWKCNCEKGNKRYY
jgi:hypothetical protein